MKLIRPLQQNWNNESDIILMKESMVACVQDFGWLNGRGLWTLILKEVKRFTKIWGQTLLSPLVMTLLFYAVFAVGFAGRPMGAVSGGDTFMAFLLPGLTMMAMAQSAFANTSVSLILSKLQGNIVDVLMPPLSPLELTIGYAVGGLVRGLAVGVLTLGALALFEPLHLKHEWIALYFAVMGSLMMSLIGLITGLWGDKFDHLGAVQNFIVMPATFLSGTFFTLEQLPEKWRIACYLNPFYYMIDGFRFGFVGHAESPVLGGMVLLLCVNLVLLHISYWMFARGTGLKP